MGRMDDALRRGGADLGRPLPAASAQVAFVPSWAIGSDHAIREPAPTANVVSRHRDPILEPHTALRREFSPEWVSRLVIAPDPPVFLVEQFRGLAATLHRARGGVDAGTSFKVIMVTSADPGEGKSLTAANLALTLSESYRHKVLLIDADLRRPSLRTLCQLPDGPGLSEGLKSPTEQKLKSVQFTDTLTVLPAGHPDPDPMSSLTSSRMQRILDEATALFDWVVVDAPPIGPIADAGLLAAMVDAALLVVRADRTKCAAVQKAIDSLGRDRILGVVLNGAVEIAPSGYGTYNGHERP